MTYRVYDTGANHLMGVFETESAAMDLIRGLIAANGSDYAEDLAVGHERPAGSFGSTLSCHELLARANETALAPA